MPAPKGNNYAKGRKNGGGRMKAGDYNFLLRLWKGEMTEDDAKENSGRSMVAQKFLEGDTKIMCKVMDKIYANKQYIEGSMDIPFKINIK